MFARFDENLAMTLQDIKETKRYGRTHGRTHARTDGQRENSIPPANFREKLSKFSLLSFCQKLFFLNQTPSCICSMCYIVSAKYQIATSKAMVGVDRPIKALSMHIKKPYKGIVV